MRDTAENRGAVQAVVRQLAGRFGGGFALNADYLAEISQSLLECPTVAVFRAVARELLSMAPTDQNGNRRVPTPYDVRKLAHEKTPAEKRAECPDCDGTGWRYFDLYKPDPCGVGVTKYEYVRRCHCRTVYRPPREPENATMADIASLVADGGGR